jgi:hypothetical protein
MSERHQFHKSAQKLSIRNLEVADSMKLVEFSNFLNIRDWRSRAGNSPRNRPAPGLVSENEQMTREKAQKNSIRKDLGRLFCVSCIDF